MVDHAKAFEEANKMEPTQVETIRQQVTEALEQGRGRKPFTKTVTVNGMSNVVALLNTSVADAKSSLECLLLRNPQQAMGDAQLALDFIESQDATGTAHSARRAMLRTIVNKASKQLSKG